MSWNEGRRRRIGPGCAVLAALVGVGGCDRVFPFRATAVAEEARRDARSTEAGTPPDGRDAGQDGRDAGQDGGPRPADLVVAKTDGGGVRPVDGAAVFDAAVVDATLVPVDGAASVSDGLLPTDSMPIVTISNPLAPATCPPGYPCEVRCTVQDSCAGTITCGDGPCTVLCTGASSCAGKITCGSGPCEVSCFGLYSCAGGVDCDGSSSCKVNCDTDTCGGQITCGAGPCTIDCGADAACGIVDCTQSCACELICREGLCPAAACPSGCAYSFGCTTSYPGCDTCPPGTASPIPP